MKWLDLGWPVSQPATKRACDLLGAAGPTCISKRSLKQEAENVTVGSRRIAARHASGLSWMTDDHQSPSPHEWPFHLDELTGCLAA